MEKGAYSMFTHRVQVSENPIPSIWLSDGIISSVSSSFIELTDFSMEDILGIDIREFSNTLRIISDVSLEDIKSPADIFIFSKSLEPIEATVYKQIDNTIGSTCYVFKEKLKSRLKDKFSFLHQLLSNNTVGVCIYKVPEIIILDANDTFLSFLDKPYDRRENSIGKPLSEVIKGWRESTFKDILEKLIETGEPLYLNDYRFDFMRGENYWNITMTPIYEENHLKYYAEITTNVTEAMVNRRKIEEQKQKIEQALKMQMEFFSYISHEFKTPIAVINASIQAMELICKDEMSDRIKNYLKKIKRSSLQQLRLVNNLLDITRADAGHLRIHKRNLDIVWLTKAITESVMPFAKQKNIDLKFSSKLKNKITAIDDALYERILLNLLSNAIKFSPEGKSIYVNVSLKESKVCINIIDEGPGIPADKQKIIFERFGQIGNELTRSSEGTGIGLSLVKLLVDALGGKILLNSEEGKGSNFCVLLPAKRIRDRETQRLHPDLLKNTLIENMNVEFSDIYFD